MLQDIKLADSSAKKNLILNNRIHCEMFYYNPIYAQLLAMRNQLHENEIEINEEDLASKIKKAIPSIEKY